MIELPTETPITAGEKVATLKVAANGTRIEAATAADLVAMAVAAVAMAAAVMITAEVVLLEIVAKLGTELITRTVLEADSSKEMIEAAMAVMEVEMTEEAMVATVVVTVEVMAVSVMHMAVTAAAEMTEAVTVAETREWTLRQKARTTTRFETETRIRMAAIPDEIETETMTNLADETTARDEPRLMREKRKEDGIEVEVRKEVDEMMTGRESEMIAESEIGMREAEKKSRDERKEKNERKENELEKMMTTILLRGVGMELVLQGLA